MEMGVLTANSRNEKNEYTIVYRSSRTKRVTSIPLWRVLKISTADRTSLTGELPARIVYVTSETQPDVQVDRGLICSRLRFGPDVGHHRDLTLEPKLDITLGPLINKVHPLARRAPAGRGAADNAQAAISTGLSTCQEPH
jgi:hypothetical protein